MYPRKVSEFITKKVAQDLEIPEQLVDEVVRFQWDSGFKAIKEHPKICFDNLGVFRMVPGRARKRLDLYRRYQKAYKNKIDTSNEIEDINYPKILTKHTTVTSDIKYLETKLQQYEDQYTGNSGGD